MKYLVILAALAFASPALAQSDTTHFKTGDSRQMPVTSASVSAQTYGSSGSSTWATSLSRNIRAARLRCTAACYVAIAPSGGNLPASAATGLYLPAGVPENFQIPAGANIAAIRVSGDGLLIITELTR